MLIAIDCGNTNTVFGVFDGDELAASWRCPTEPEKGADHYAKWLTASMAEKKMKAADIGAAIVAGVVPAMDGMLAQLCRETFGTEPLVVGTPGVDLGIKVMVDRPEEVGADRLVNALAVAERHVVPAIVVDFGTATSFDVVDGAGNFQGGVIAPGPILSVAALHAAAAKLPEIEVARPERVIGKNTVGAMHSGVYWGYVGLVEGLVARISAELGGNVTVVATGGLAQLFTEATPVINSLDPDLTLYGLMYAYRRNAGRAKAE